VHEKFQPSTTAPPQRLHAPARRTWDAPPNDAGDDDAAPS